MGEYFTVENNDKSIKEAIKRIKKYKPTRITIEATGRLEMPFACAATKAKLPIAIANPRQVHDFAKSTGKLARIDKLDAAMIAYYGELLTPRLTQIKPKNTQNISNLLVRRSQLVDMRTMEKNCHSILSKEIKCSNIRIINAFQKEIAALVGVAPINRESGLYKGKRRIRGGRARIRTVHFMAMMCIIQSNPRFKRDFQRLVAKGKPKKVAIVACMRKMITILNVMVKTETMRDENIA